MSIDCIKRFWLACALAVLGAGAAAQEPTDMERLRSQVATIRDRAALTHFVADESEFNPLAKLSSGARARLLAYSLYSSSGEITSLYFRDIVEELKPADAYQLFALFAFGFPCSSMIAAHGASSVGRDRSVLETVCGMRSQKIGIATTYEGYYCNGGYCTSNHHFVCNTGSCKPR